MIVGMIGSAAVFLTAVGMTADEALRQHAVSFVVLQAFGMTVAIVAWMRHVVTRGEVLAMAAAMIVPAVALIRLRLVGIIGGPICGVWRWCSSRSPDVASMAASQRQYPHAETGVAQAQEGSDERLGDVGRESPYENVASSLGVAPGRDRLRRGGLDPVGFVGGDPRSRRAGSRRSCRVASGKTPPVGAR